MAYGKEGKEMKKLAAITITLTAIGVAVKVVDELTTNEI